MVLRFGLFPYCLLSLQIFFCRTDMQLPSSLLRSDPSIVCWDSAHVIAMFVAVAVFLCCCTVAPLLLLRALKHTIGAQRTNSDETATEGLSPAVEANYRRAFERYDSDGSGLIDQLEMHQLLEDHTSDTVTPAANSSCFRKLWDWVFAKKPMSQQRAEEMRGWMGLTADEAVSMDDFLRMLTRMHRELQASAYDQQ
jgi:hypothetical protein